jgi:hypothetical protein
MNINDNDICRATKIHLAHIRIYIFHIGFQVSHYHYLYFHKHIYYHHHLWQTTNTVSLGTVILCINIGLKINYINTCETPQRQDSSITNTAFKCIWTGIELGRTEMFWKREFPNISNQHYWTLDCNCLNTVDSVSTIQVYSHKEAFVSDWWIVEWKPFPLLSCQYDCLVRHGRPSECSRCTVNKSHIHADTARRKQETKVIYRQTKSKKERSEWLNKR